MLASSRKRSGDGRGLRWCCRGEITGLLCGCSRRLLPGKGVPTRVEELLCVAMRRSRRGWVVVESAVLVWAAASRERRGISCWICAKQREEGALPWEELKAANRGGLGAALDSCAGEGGLLWCCRPGCARI